MNSEKENAGPDAERSLQDLVAQSDRGAREPIGTAGRILIGTALAWSLFQLWYASPLPFLLEVGVLNNTQARSIHLAFALFLAYTAFPALKRSPTDHVPLQDWLLAVLAAGAGAYLFLFYQELSERPGAPLPRDVIVACIGVLVLLEATRRALGPPLAIVAIILLCYTYFGPYMPSAIWLNDAPL